MAITVRRIQFDLPDEIDPMVVEGRPEESFMNVSMSLLLPYLEPYLIRSVRAAREHVRDPALLADLDAFVAQEGQHYRQHMRFNEAVRKSELGDLAPLEAALEADYRRFTERRSLRFNLAYAEGFEAYTSAVARWSIETRMIQRVNAKVRDLFLWHLVEELEHRTVAFDIYQAVCGGYFYRLVVGFYAQWHLNAFVNSAINCMVKADPKRFRARFGGRWASFTRLRPFLGSLLRSLLPKVLATMTPWYSPHRIKLSEEVLRWADEYAERARKDLSPR